MRDQTWSSLKTNNRPIQSHWPMLHHRAAWYIECMRISQVKPDPWLAVNLHHLVLYGAAFNTQSRRSRTDEMRMIIAYDRSHSPTSPVNLFNWITYLVFLANKCCFSAREQIWLGKKNKTTSYSVHSIKIHHRIALHKPTTQFISD